MEAFGDSMDVPGQVRTVACAADTPADAFLDMIEKMMRLIDDFPMDSIDAFEGEADDPSDDGEDGPENEYGESYEETGEELREYVRKFREYAGSIKNDAGAIYGSGKRAVKRNEEKPDDFFLRSPQERGHKMGCGCPGCGAYREFFGIKIGGETLPSSASIVKETSMAAKSKDAGKYEETGSRPCGGRLFSHFHGERADLKNVLGKYTPAFDFSRAGY
jgi:hypothetical protein